MKSLFLFGALMCMPVPLLAQAWHVISADDLTQTLTKTQDGDALVLASGVYKGSFMIDKSLHFSGKGAILDGEGAGSVLVVTAPDVTIMDLEIRNSGVNLSTLDSGISLSETATGAMIDSVVLSRNLIGIDVQGAKNVTIQNAQITGRNDLRVPERGPGIYVWQAPGLLVENNHIAQGRDGVFITTSDQAVYKNNHFSDLRFAFHSMYANNISVVNNISDGNDMGFAFMYSRNLDVRNNLSKNDKQHGFFMNFANQAVLEGNEVQDGGEKCLFFYNANHNTIKGNKFSDCEIGIHFTAGSQDNQIFENTFMNNQTQVKYVGTTWIEWSLDERGNYWSDHVAFDIDQDGVADAPYRPNDSIDRLIWSQPMASTLMGTPAMQLVRWSQARFPGIRPGGIVDSAPLMRSPFSGAVQ